MEGVHVGVAVHRDELLELLSDKLPSVVRDESQARLRKRLQRLLVHTQSRRCGPP